MRPGTEGDARRVLDVVKSGPGPVPPWAGGGFGAESRRLAGVATRE
ncbi:hypothetical protein [Roseococcus sp. SYP-B2431]|nr:hypothetical protein [Roseococcus sp. SYP-B2431]